MIKALIAFNVLIWFVLAYGESSDQMQHDQQEVILARATDQVGMPTMENFEERKMLRKILEARDRSVSTTTYLVDANGHLHKLCDSVGYGIPSATQFTNPEQYKDRGSALSQAEPNGLFPSSQSDGIWLNCKNPTSNEPQVVLTQPHVVVSPFPLPVD